METSYEVYAEAYEFYIQKEEYKYGASGGDALSDRAHEFALKVMELEHNQELHNEFQFNLGRM